MLPAVADILAAYDFLAERYGLTDGPTPEPLEEALADPRALASRPEDEPAALFYALVRRPEEMGDAWTLLPALLAKNHAGRLGLELHAGHERLGDLRFDILVERLAFEPVRAWFRERSRPRRAR